MPVSNANVGLLYIPGGPGGYWTQPGGKGTRVFPAQENGPFNGVPANPIPPGNWSSETSGLWTVGCGHSVDYPKVYRDFDDNTQMSAAVIACPMCSYTQYIVEPYEEIFNTLSYPYIII